MSGIDHLIQLCDEYARVTGADVVTVSWRVFGDSKKLGALKTCGADIQVRRYEKAIRWLADNWPEAATWPAHIARPPAAEEAA